MKRLFLTALLLPFLGACGSSDVTNTGSNNGSGSDSTIVIPTESRQSLPQLPDVAFNGRYENTAPVDAGIGGGDSDIRTEDGAVVSSPDMASGTSDSLGGTGGTGSTGGISIPAPPIQNIQPGTLTAGDYDDHLNPHLYQNYASDYLQQRGQWIDVPRIDFNNRIKIVVTDKAGQPYADARVEVTGGSQSALTIHTAANGMASLYSELDSLSDNFRLRVTATDGTAAQQDIDLQQALKAGIIQVALDTTDQSNSADDAPIDLMFVVDTTGSMTDELNFLQTELSDIISSVTEQQSGIKIGLVFYRDYGDNYIVRAHGFSDDLNSVQLNLNQEQAQGGGDYPEAMDQALQAAIGADWRNNSRKVMFLIADAPPHSDRMRATWTAAEQARKKNIHIVPVAASGVAEDAEYIMRSVAALTDSRYLFLTDDSGFGLSHAEPDIDCYVVTSLRKAMIRALNSLVSGSRVEPASDDIIRRVGNYDNGTCAQINEPSPNGIKSTVLINRSSINDGTFTQKQTSTITSQSALDEALQRYNEASVTADFNNGQVLLIDMGQKNTGGYSIELESLIESEGYVTANIVFNNPGRNCAVTTALTNPYIFVYVETNKEIRFSETTKSTDCSF